MNLCAGVLLCVRARVAVASGKMLRDGEEVCNCTGDGIEASKLSAPSPSSAARSRGQCHARAPSEEVGAQPQPPLAIAPARNCAPPPCGRYGPAQSPRLGHSASFAVDKGTRTPRCSAFFWPPLASSQPRRPPSAHGGRPPVSVDAPPQIWLLVPQVFPFPPRPARGRPRESLLQAMHPSAKASLQNPCHPLVSLRPPLGTRHVQC